MIDSTDSTEPISDAVSPHPTIARSRRPFGERLHERTPVRVARGIDVAARHRLTDADLAWFFLLLINAGGGTSATSSAPGCTRCSSTPTSSSGCAGVHEDRELDVAIEELLRWVSPVVHMRRTATADARIGDTDIAAGDKVVLYYGAANRDPAVYDEPEVLDITRTPSDHLTFGGGGPHFCLGATLARIEIRALLREILVRLPNLEPAGEPSWLASNFIYGPTRLPVRF